MWGSQASWAFEGCFLESVLPTAGFLRAMPGGLAPGPAPTALGADLLGIANPASSPAQVRPHLLPNARQVEETWL